jgi:hypothetical protein
MNSYLIKNRIQIIKILFYEFIFKFLLLKKTIYKLSFLFIVLLTPITLTIGQPTSWVLERNENGIKVYTRMYSGFNFKEVKVINRVKSTLSAMVALLFDTKNYPLWVYGCSETRTIKFINDRERYNYQVTDLPWPLSDRDVVSHFKVTQDSTTNIVTFSKIGKSDLIPEVDGMVRVQHFESICIFKKVAMDSIEITLQMHLDGGGNVPMWLVNDNVVNGPYYSTLAMIDRLPYYQSAKYNYIKEE